MVSLLTLIFILMIEGLGKFCIWMFHVWVWFLKIMGILVLASIWIAIVVPFNVLMLIVWGVAAIVAYRKKRTSPGIKHNKIWMVYPFWEV